MSTYGFVFLCIQVCLVQSIFSQCTSRAAVADISGLPGPYGFAAPYGLTAPCGRTGPYGLAARGIAANGIIPELIAPGISAPYGLTSPLSYDGLGYPGVAPYGGTGEGNVAVAGQLPVTGTTTVAGQIPIMGAVSFGGPVAAAGSVSIFGKCACGCNSPIYY